jgi:hypothetical protein
VVTQNFGSRPGIQPMVTGVAYFDLNGNGFYDIGEGLAQVIVTVEAGSYLAATANSGGYSVPLPGNGSYQLSFKAPHLTPILRSVEIANGQNTKADLVLEYVPPVVTGPDQLRVNTSYSLPIKLTPGAAHYQVLVARSIAVPSSEGAESPIPAVVIESSPGYEVIQSTVKASGNHAFHLAHPVSAPQRVLLNRLFHPSASSELVFQSRLGWASTNQQAHVEVSTDGGTSWRTVWERFGNGQAGPAGFAPERVSLGAYAGQAVAIRFSYSPKPGLFFNQTSAGVGWYFDDLQFNRMDELVGKTVYKGVSDRFIFTPAQEGDYILFAQAEVSGRLFPSGTGLRVHASTTAAEPVTLRIAGVNQRPAGGLELLVSIQTALVASIGLESSSDPAGPWTREAGAQVLPAGDGTARILTSGSSASHRFYRLVLP